MNQREVISLHMDNSAQKNSTEEDDTKYIKTPELNLQEKYSHNNPSGIKISGKSTEKDGKVTKRFLTSQKKKVIKVSKEVIECKKDLIKLQKKSEYRKKKKMDQENQQKEIERRKQNIATLNLMLKKRNQHFKKKKRNQEKLMKKEAINFERPAGTSFNKKGKKKRINVKNMKRNQTFSNLSNKSPCETMNTSKNQFSSHKKKNFHVSTGKKLTYKKMNESLKTNTSSKKLRSDNKLGAKSVNASQYFNPSKGYGNTYKKRKTIKSESKKYTKDAGTHFNDISEIQEFNMTDEEESLINSSILKNIEDHESLRHTENAGKSSMKKQKTTTRKTLQSTKKKHKKTVKKTRLKFISSSKKSSKKTKKCTEKDHTEKSLKKRKVIFHSSKLKEVSPVERIHRDPEYLEEAINPQNDYRNMESPEDKSGQIKKVEYSNHFNEDEEESDEIIDLKNSQEGKNLEKIDMIDPEKLSELLSSKKKHRYQEVKDSMDGVAETNIHQQIDFTDEEENLNLHQYHSPGVDSPDQQQSLSQDDEVANSALH